MIAHGRARFDERPDTCDAHVIDEVWTHRMYDSLAPDPADIVLDIGANIGAYSVRAALAGARVIAVEPHPENALALRRNLELSGVADRVEVIEAAAVCGSLPVRTQLWTAGGAYVAGSWTLFRPSEPVDVIDVATVDVTDLLAKHAPTLVKLDCEGAEYELFPAIATCDSVRRVALEAHVAMVAHGAPLYARLFEEATLSFKGVTAPSPPEAAAHRHVMVHAWR